MQLLTFSKSLTVIGQGYFIVMKSRVYPEQTTTSNMLSLVSLSTSRHRSHRYSLVSFTRSVRLIAVVATRIQTFTVEEFAAISSEKLAECAFSMQQHHSKRLQQRRFHDVTDGYLAELETNISSLYHLKKKKRSIEDYQAPGTSTVRSCINARTTAVLPVGQLLIQQKLFGWAATWSLIEF